MGTNEKDSRTCAAECQRLVVSGVNTCRVEPGGGEEAWLTVSKQHSGGVFSHSVSPVLEELLQQGI